MGVSKLRERIISAFTLLSIILFTGIGLLNIKPEVKSVQTVGAAQVDYFLKLDGIEGESKDAGHEGQIVIDSFSWGENSSEAGMILPAVQSARESSGGKATVSDFHFEKKMDKASPKLMEAAASGQHFNEAILIGLRAGDDRQEFMIIKFSDLLVSSYQTGGNSSDIPTDSFSLNFSKIEFEYKTQNPDGSAGETVKGGWDVKKNEKI
jgi:type VI secretion system secreted protein Hcp